MPKAYWIVRVTVTDAESYPAYLAAGAAVHEKFGSRFLVRGGRCDGVEGLNRDRNVVVEFKDYETAVAAYNSPEYAQARALRQRAADSDFLIVEGIE